MQLITSIDNAVALVGTQLGVSEWKEVEQQRIDAFADITEDHQWIHVDVDRATTESPYRTTIAHGFLTLALIPALSKGNYQVRNAKLGINYGLNRVRFLSPVTAGSRVRARSQLLGVTKVDDTTVNLTVRHTIDIEGSDQPAAVADLISRWIF